MVLRDETHRLRLQVFPRPRLYNIVTLILRHGAVRRRFGVGEASLWRSCRIFLAGRASPAPTSFPDGQTTTTATVAARSRSSIFPTLARAWARKSRFAA